MPGALARWDLFTELSELPGRLDGMIDSKITAATRDGIVEASIPLHDDAKRWREP